MPHKKTITAICIILIIFSLNSCFTKKKDFFAYKYPLIKSGNPLSIKTNGFYAPVDIKGRILFLYENRIVKEGPWVSDFFFNKSKYFDIINEDYYTQKGKEYFGSFMIKDTSIVIQLFNIHTSHNPIYRRWVFESSGLITSDTTIVLYSNFEYLNKNEFYKVPVLFKFVPYENKPDSSNAWFRNKTWYNENMHDSRR
ncbi:MAG: hypothetical protein KGZ82_07170 [Bacteroidales bacterium]|nr:hypothetical protein [Bacteroidales bacterium]